MIYSVFAGVGKTTLAQRNTDFVDLESSEYQWIYPNADVAAMNKEARKGVAERVRNPLFPGIYVDAIERYDAAGKHVLIAAQPEVLQEIECRGLQYTVVMPSVELKEAYLERYRMRGNNEDFVAFMEKNFEAFVESMQQNEYAVKQLVILTADTYLEDVLLIGDEQ